MSAGTETTIDTRGYNGANYVGNIVEKVLLARQLAENERKYASKKAEEAGTSLEEAGIEKGHFFKKALAGEFGGNYIDRKKEQLQNVVKKYKIAKRLTKNPKATFKFIKPLLKKKVGSAQTKMFRAKFDYMYSDDINRPIPQSPKVGNTAKKIQKATAARSKRVSKEELLSTLTGIVDSLNKTAESIGKTTAGISSGVISAAKAQVDLVEQLKLRNTTLEDKLDKIALAIANQTQFQKRSVAKANTKQAEDKLEAIKDTASTEVPDDTETAVNETQLSQLSQNITPTTNIINNPAIERPRGGYPSLSEMGKGGMHIPEAETGGIVTGPDSGYLAKLHGDEMVVPINNNYTQGEPSAMDGKVRPKPSSSSRSKTGTPQSSSSRSTKGTTPSVPSISSKGINTSSLPSFERGTPGSSVGGRFGFGITNMRGIASGGSTQSSAMAQPLVDAMSLPMMATGGSILATVSKLMTSMGSEGTIIAPEIERISRPIADVFGLPPSIVKKTKQGMASKTTAGSFGEANGEDDGESKKNIFNKLMDGFGALMEKLKDGMNNNPPPGPTGGGGDPNFSGSSGSEQAMNYFTSQGLTKEQSAGIVGNLMQESGAGLDPNAKNASGHRGIAQWDPNRWGQFEKWAAKKGLDVNTREAQLQWIMEEMKTGSGGLGIERFKSSATTAEKAAALFLKDYERSGEVAGQHGYDIRMKNAKNLAASFKPSSSPSPSSTSYQTTSTVQLGQAITNNYGMKVGEERTFTHPEYGELKAHKTTKGFDFYRGGTILDVSPSSPQGKSIVNYFTSTNGGISTSTMGPQAKITPPPGSDKNTQTQTIAQKIDDKGNANIIAMMMPPGQKQQMASTSQPSSAENSAALPGYNALTQSGLYNPLYG
jgi:hypothetical protein